MKNLLTNHQEEEVIYSIFGGVDVPTVEIDTEEVSNTLHLPEDYQLPSVTYTESNTALIEILRLRQDQPGDAVVLLGDVDNYVVTVIGPSRVVINLFWDEDQDYISTLETEKLPFLHLSSFDRDSQNILKLYLYAIDFD